MRRVTLVIALMVSPPCRDVGTAHGRPSVDPLQFIRTNQPEKSHVINRLAFVSPNILNLKLLPFAVDHFNDIAFLQVGHSFQPAVYVKLDFVDHCSPLLTS